MNKSSISYKIGQAAVMTALALIVSSLCFEVFLFPVVLPFPAGHHRSGADIDGMAEDSSGIYGELRAAYPLHYHGGCRS